MTFLYPSFLWALTALAIPIIIHLFNFRKTTRVMFSNTRFLKEVKDATTAKRRLKHYLILLSRLLFLFFLIITFCQPIIPAADQLGSGRNIIFYLDNSQSMSAQTSSQSRGLEVGTSFARSIVEIFPPDTRYKLLTNDFSPSSNTFKTNLETLDLLTQIRLSPVSRTYKEITDRIAQSTTRRQEVFWISDFQKSTQGAISRWDSVAKLHLVPIKLGKQSNVFIDTAFLENPFAAGGGKNVLHLKVRNDGDKDADRLNLKLTINNIQAGTTAVTIPAKGIAETTFDIATTMRGANAARITFNDFPITFDNEFYMALNFTDKIRVVEVRGLEAGAAVEKVFGNKEVFSVNSHPVDNFNYNLLAQADLVVVNGLNTVATPLAGALQSHMRDGGTVLFFPGKNPDVANLNGFLQLPTLGRAPETELQELDKPDFSNPFFENVFEEKSISIAMPRAKKLLTWGPDRSSILRFKNDEPFLSRDDQGEGTLFIVATALETGQTDFFNHALFVPVMYRIASSSIRNDSKLYYTLKESFISLRLDSLPGEQPLRWVGEDEIVPAQRKLNDRVIFDLPKFSITKGFYSVVADSDTVSLLAFNLDKTESLLDQYTAETMQELLGGGDRATIFDVGTQETFSNEIKERYLGTALWKYALLIAILFLLVEILLIRFLK